MLLPVNILLHKNPGNELNAVFIFSVSSVVQNLVFYCVYSLNWFVITLCWLCKISCRKLAFITLMLLVF